MLPSDSHSEDQTPPKRQNSLPIVIQVQRAASGDENDCYGKSPLKKQRPSFSRPTSPRPERKDRPCKNDTVVQKMEAMYRARDTRNGCTQAHSLLSVKEEMRLVEDLKIRRARALLAIEKKCDDGCREGLNPCSVLLQLETIHDGHYQSCKKGA